MYCAALGDVYATIPLPTGFQGPLSKIGTLSQFSATNKRTGCGTLPSSTPGKLSLDRHYRQCREDPATGIELHGHSGEHPLPGRGAAHRPHEIGCIGVCEHLLDVLGFLSVGLQRDLHLWRTIGNCSPGSPRAMAYRAPCSSPSGPRATSAQTRATSLWPTCRARGPMQWGRFSSCLPRSSISPETEMETAVRTSGRAGRAAGIGCWLHGIGLAARIHLGPTGPDTFRIRSEPRGTRYDEAHR